MIVQPPRRRGVTVWFTGLSGAGKSTLAEALAPRLAALGHRVELLDGDAVRTHLSKGLGFSREDRDTNVRRIGWVAQLLTRNGVFVITAAISPYREARDWCRESIRDFVEVHVSTPLEACAARDVKGLYQRALAGEIPHFTGVNDPYEAPTDPALTLDTQHLTIDEGVERVLGVLRARGYLPAADDTTEASSIGVK